MNTLLTRTGVFAAATLTAVAGIAAPAHAAPATPLGGGTGTAQAVIAKTAPGSTVVPLRSSGLTCSGTLLGTIPVKTKTGVTVAQLELYGRTTAKGTAIACFRHMGPTKNVYLPTSAVIAACADSACTKPLASSAATGLFRSWAGPAAIGGLDTVKHVCVAASGAMKLPNGTVAVAKTQTICD